MTICSIFGHDNLYDLDLYPIILKAIKKVVSQNIEVTFVFDKQTQFTALCLVAILEARQRNPDKRLNTAYFTRSALEEVKLQPFSADLFPSFIFDTIIQLPDVTCDLSKAPFEWRREKKALINHSNYLICYEYSALHDHYFDIYESAFKRADLTVYNVIKQETAQAILDSVNMLETKQQYIFKSLKTGKSYQSIGSEFGVSGATVRSKDMKGRRILRAVAEERYTQLLRERASSPSPVCAIILPTKMDKEDELRFRQVIDFLDRHMGVGAFLVEHLNCHSDFVRYLLQIKPFRRFRVNLFTHWGSTTEEFVPPFDGVINVGSEARQLKIRYTQALSAMLRQCDFAICKSTIDSDTATFRQIQKHKNLKVFNLGVSQERVIIESKYV